MPDPAMPTSGNCKQDLRGEASRPYDGRPRMRQLRFYWRAQRLFNGACGVFLGAGYGVHRPITAEREHI
jgi:hypothetical protein